MLCANAGIKTIVCAFDHSICRRHFYYGASSCKPLEKPWKCRCHCSSARRWEGIHYEFRCRVYFFLPRRRREYWWLERGGPWIHGKTWDATAKLVVAGARNWPTAKFNVQVVGANRVLTTNDLPTGQPTGTFPISSSDPAYKYDGNPNAIGSSASRTVTLPTEPAPSSTPSCLGEGPSA